MGYSYKSHPVEEKYEHVINKTIIILTKTEMDTWRRAAIPDSWFSMGDRKLLASMFT